MSPNRMVVLAATFLSLTLGVATTAHAKKWSLIGGGAQSNIGNGLALPIQQAPVNSVTTGTMFPTLLIPVKGQPIITGTTVKPLLTAGTKMGYQRKLHVPAGALHRNAVKKTVGVKFSNPSLQAVATNLTYDWPSAPAVFSTGVAPPAVITGFGGSMTYSNALGARFGGPASFAIGNGDPVAGDLYPTAPVTLFLKINAATAPCTFPIPATTMGAGCVNGIMLAKPTGIGGIGGNPAATVTTPGGPVPVTSANPGGLNVVGVKMGLTPLGTHLAPPVLAAKVALPTNMAMSQPGPWTTGQVIIANPAAVPMTETWTLSGKDSRTAGGNGTIQLVSGSVSSRPASGANANRGWVTLQLGTLQDVPSMSVGARAATIGLILLAFGYTMRRRIFA